MQQQQKKKKKIINNYTTIVGCSQCCMKWLNDCDLRDVMEPYYAKGSNICNSHEHTELHGMHTKKKITHKYTQICYVKSNRLPFAIRFGEECTKARAKYESDTRRLRAHQNAFAHMRSPTFYNRAQTFITIPENVAAGCETSTYFFFFCLFCFVRPLFVNHYELQLELF